MNVAIRPGAHVLGTLDNLHVAEDLAINPLTNLVEIHIIHCHTVPNRIADGSNFAQKFDPSFGKREPQRSLNTGMMVQLPQGRQHTPWDDCFLEQRKMGSKAVANKKPLARQPCLTPLAMRNCPRVVPANSTYVVLS